MIRESTLTIPGPSSTMAGMKRFILVADDFGISPEVNRAVELAYRAGAVKYASLMVKGDASEEAVVPLPSPAIGV